jgi:hypothetical protein
MAAVDQTARAVVPAVALSSRGDRILSPADGGIAECPVFSVLGGHVRAFAFSSEHFSGVCGVLNLQRFETLTLPEIAAAARDALVAFLRRCGLSALAGAAAATRWHIHSATLTEILAGPDKEFYVCSCSC